MARTTAEILEDLQEVRARNKGLYAYARDVLTTDDTLAVVKLMYLKNPEAAKRWHLKVLENDIENLELTRELVGLSCE